MKLPTYKGIRVRPQDKHLFLKFNITVWVIIFIFLMMIFHAVPFMISWFNMTFLIVSIICSLVVSSIGLYVCHHKYIDIFKKREHRQKLAEMILSNGWYNTIQKEKLFSQTGKTKTKIKNFPKLYYHMKKGLIYISVGINMGKHQDKLETLENKLETGLYCELLDKELQESYIRYVLLYDTISNRINISDVQAENGKLKLMENVYWRYDELPHLLVAGGTGSGKTYFLLTLIEAVKKIPAEVYVIDPKNSDLIDLKTIMTNVYSEKDDILSCVKKFSEDMKARSEAIKQLPNYKTGENYAYYGLKPHFLFFDEYVAFADMLGRDNTELIKDLKQILMLGRQAGYFLVLACQRPDSKYFGEGSRDQFNFRVALGRMSEDGYKMMFGSDTDKKFFLKPIKGRGYFDHSTNVISEFYTPLIPKGYDFLKQIEIAHEQGITNNQEPSLSGEAEDKGVGSLV